MNIKALKYSFNPSTEQLFKKWEQIKQYTNSYRTIPNYENTISIKFKPKLLNYSNYHPKISTYKLKTQIITNYQNTPSQY